MRKHLTSFDLKLIAILTMTIDHMGYYLFPMDDWMRLVGRIAMPIFAFLCAESFRYTRDKKTYALRMIVFGIIYTAVRLFVDPSGNGDIFLTLGLGFMMLWGLEEKQYLITLSAFIIGVLVPVDYYWYGLWMVPMMYYLKDHRVAMLFTMIGMNVLLVSFSNVHPMQYFSVISLLFIWLYNNQVGCKKWKYLFYVYYPVHVVILAALAWF